MLSRLKWLISNSRSSSLSSTKGSDIMVPAGHLQKSKFSAASRVPICLFTEPFRVVHFKQGTSQKRWGPLWFAFFWLVFIFGVSELCLLICFHMFLAFLWASQRHHNVTSNQNKKVRVFSSQPYGTAPPQRSPKFDKF